jgi:nucleoside-diphosphate-sugar epimerase
VGILITGGSGFVGLNLVEQLLGAGQDVVIFGHAPPPESALAEFSALAGQCMMILGDICSGADLDRAFKAMPIDRVIHAAAVTANLERERASPRMIMDVNLIGAIELLEAMRRHHVRRVLLASSVAVYGFPNVPPDGVCEESRCPEPANLYGISKLAAEQSALRLAHLHDLTLTIARIGPAYGPWEYHSGVRDVLSPQWQSVDLARAGRPVTFSRPAIGDWLYSRDAAAGLIALLEAQDLRHMIYNVGSGTRWSLDAWVEGLAAKIPGFTRGTGAALSDEASVRVQTAQDRAAMAIQRITEDTSYVPRYGLDSSLADYLSWLDAHPDFPRSS